MKGVEVIGTFHPVLQPDDRVRIIQAWVDRFGGDEEEIRTPEANISSDVHDVTTTHWHHDCGGRNSITEAALFWSNTIPIQFKRHDRIWSPQPFEVVLFDNTDRYLKHRRPPGITIADNRWSIVDRRSRSFTELRKEFLSR
jgi:hypothetical protein